MPANRSRDLGAPPFARHYRAKGGGAEFPGLPIQLVSVLYNQPTMHPETPNPQTPQRIVLIGFMGAGKSTVGPILAEQLGWRFFDSDHSIQARTGTTIADSFTALGEPAFRQIEAEVIAGLLEEHEVILSLGGGAIETESTRSLLLESAATCTIFLQAPLGVLIDRCEGQPGAAVRPVLRQREALRQRFHYRLPHYQNAHLTVDTEGLDPASVADLIVRRMVEDSYALPLIQKAITR